MTVGVAGLQAKNIPAAVVAGCSGLQRWQGAAQVCCAAGMEQQPLYPHWPHRQISPTAPLACLPFALVLRRTPPAHKQAGWAPTGRLPLTDLALVRQLAGLLHAVVSRAWDSLRPGRRRALRACLAACSPGSEIWHDNQPCCPITAAWAPATRPASWGQAGGHIPGPKHRAPMSSPDTVAAAGSITRPLGPPPLAACLSSR